jgi:hypothetical protein
MDDRITIFVRLDVSNGCSRTNFWARPNAIIKMRLENAVGIQTDPYVAFFFGCHCRYGLGIVMIQANEDQLTITMFHRKINHWMDTC